METAEHLIKRLDQKKEPYTIYKTPTRRQYYSLLDTLDGYGHPISGKRNTHADNWGYNRNRTCVVVNHDQNTFVEVDIKPGSITPDMGIQEFDLKRKKETIKKGPIYDPIELADYIVFKSIIHKRLISNIELNIILYFLQAAYLEQKNKPFIGELFQNRFNISTHNYLSEPLNKLTPRFLKQNTPLFEEKDPSFFSKKHFFKDHTCPNIISVYNRYFYFGNSSYNPIYHVNNMDFYKNHTKKELKEIPDLPRHLHHKDKTPTDASILPQNIKSFIDENLPILLSYTTGQLIGAGMDDSNIKLGRETGLDPQHIHDHFRRKIANRLWIKEGGIV